MYAKGRYIIYLLIDQLISYLVHNHNLCDGGWLNLHVFYAFIKKTRMMHHRHKYTIRNGTVLIVFVVLLHVLAVISHILDTWL